MDIVIPVGLALVGIFIAWKVLKGLVKLAAIVGVLALAAYVYFGMM